MNYGYLLAIKKDNNLVVSEYGETDNLSNDKAKIVEFLESLTNNSKLYNKFTKQLDYVILVSSKEFYIKYILPNANKPFDTLDYYKKLDYVIPGHLINKTYDILNFILNLKDKKNIIVSKAIDNIPNNLYCQSLFLIDFDNRTFTESITSLDVAKGTIDVSKLDNLDYNIFNLLDDEMYYDYFPIKIKTKQSF